MARRPIILLRIILWLILASAIVWLVILKIVPSGKISYFYNFKQPSYFIGKLAPEERVILSNGQAGITGDPVYFSLYTPRRFERASLIIKFKNTTNLPVLEMGLLNDKVAWGYDLKPLQNKIIDQLSLVWPVVYGQNGVQLIQREKKYDTVEKFLSHLSDNRRLADETAVYNYSPKSRFLLGNYLPQNKEQSIDCNFRGSYQFYTYIKNEELNYIFNFTDFNINKDNDPVDIKVYSSDGLIHTEHIADDQAASFERRAGLKIPNLKEGIYRISFIANDDIVTKNIISRQSQLALINKVWLADSDKKNVILYTNSRLISAQTINPASLEKIKLGDSAIDLNQTYKQFSLKVLSRPAKIELNKSDVIISGDGVFSFNENSLLDPRLKNVDKNIDINQDKINYILTNYKRPKEFQGWQTATADFDLTKAYQENGKYQFLISIPGLKAGEPLSGGVIIKEIKVELFGTSLRQKLDKYFSK